MKKARVRPIKRKKFLRSFLKLFVICALLFVIAYFAGQKAADTFQLQSSAFTLRTQQQNSLFGVGKKTNGENRVNSQTEPLIIPQAASACDDRPGRDCYEYGNFTGQCDATNPNNLQCLACKDCLGVETPNGAACAERKCYTRGPFKGCGNPTSCSGCAEYARVCGTPPLKTSECFVLDCASLTSGGSCFNKVINPDGAGKKCDESKGYYENQNICFANILPKCIAGIPTGIPQQLSPTPQNNAGCTPHDWSRCAVPSGGCCEDWGNPSSCGWNKGQSWADCQQKCQNIANASSPFCNSAGGGQQPTTVPGADACNAAGTNPCNAGGKSCCPGSACVASSNTCESSNTGAGYPGGSCPWTCATSATACRNSGGSPHGSGGCPAGVCCE